MATDISSIRTMQDVINVLSVVYFNMNEVERVYYDIFINPIPMDVELQRYDDEGVLETILVPNRAKSSFNVLTGSGNPNGVTLGNIGALYIDTAFTNDLYYKSTGSDAYGWLKVLNGSNFRAGVDYLTPTGNGSQLTGINASNISSGVLPVSRGGTGVSSITGLIKGNGTGAFSKAVEGTDYMGATSLTGIIAFFPVNTKFPSGWLKCDGAAYNRTTYSRLFNVIGTTYGVGNGSTTFNVPDLRNYFIRCWDGSRAFNNVQAAQVGGHTHTFSGTTSSSGQNHTHTKGSMQITGRLTATDWEIMASDSVEKAGALSCDYGTTDTLFSRNLHQRNVDSIIFDTSLDNGSGWTGSTSVANANHNHTYSGTTASNNGTAENTVLNKALVPLIKF